jgi:hypothetical protein
MCSYLPQGEGPLNSFTIHKLLYRWGKFNSFPPHPVWHKGIISNVLKSCSLGCCRSSCCCHIFLSNVNIFLMPTLIYITCNSLRHNNGNSVE